MRTVAMISSALALVSADVYMQYPPGANNRLDEGGGNRNNNNRLMDSQNNAKGGYGYGGDAGNKALPLKYMTGSTLNVAWTSQHSCGSENAECQIVLQYMCNDGQSQTPQGLPQAAAAIDEGPLRDGTDGGTPDPNNPNQNRGLHEPASFYNDCDTRERNQGLYTADQNLNGNDARRTRQNPNGARSGLECPEERDYYPYWHPSPWRDLAIMSNNLELCQWYQAESQNVKAKNYCSQPQHNNQQSCQNGGGQWLAVQPFGIPPPECIAAPFQRDNHLGNAAGDSSGSEVMLNVSIPSSAGTGGISDADNCVVRLRYNITTSDTRACEDGNIKTKEECTAAGLIWSAAFVDYNYNKNDALIQGNPKVSMGPLAEAGRGDPDNPGDGFLSGTGGTDSLLELAVNTNQYGRTFQDRSHVFSIQERPARISENVNIQNLNVKGKRGNIVQTYPATEYDFHPVDLTVGQNDWVHVQWTGNDNTNNNGNNNGEGTNNEDRHNIVQVAETGYDVPLPGNAANMFDVRDEWNPDTSNEFSGTRNQASLTKQFALSKQTNCLTAGDVNGDQQRQNCEKLNAAAATVDLGMVKFNAGSYNYYSTRNNNFSNRAQKAKLNVLDKSSVPPWPPSTLTAQAVENEEGNAKGKVWLEWKSPGSRLYAATSGNMVVGNNEQQNAVMGYKVYQSPDAGQNWYIVQGCSGTATSCMVEGVPAGTVMSFQVRSGSSAGWSDPSEPAMVKTIDTGLSQSCNAQLASEAGGNYMTTGGIVAIVVGIFAGLVLLGFLAFMGLLTPLLLFLTCRRQPPPPPPGGGEYKEQPLQ